MGEVRYSINGKYFKDFGIYVSDSDGLFDALKRKKVNTYDWAEYHGSAPDLSSPKYEQREISLKCFVVGDNWEVMKSNFDAIISEFQKAGTQRLLIEPFGLKALPYEVYMDDSISLKKTFKNGKIVGIFTLKLIEPNPIKKVLYFADKILNLSYTSPKETEIFYGNGLKDIVKGNASISGKTVENNIVSSYVYEGRNLLLNSDFQTNLSGWNGTNTGETYSWNAENGGSLYLESGGVNGGIYQVFFSTPGNYIVSFYVKPGFQSGTAPYKVRITLAGTTVDIAIHTSPIWQRYSVAIQSTALNSIFSIQALGNQKLFFDKIKLAKESSLSDWTPAPEEQKYIIIAGNIEEITDLTTNADKILWERL